LRISVFRTLWITAPAANLGAWMQTADALPDRDAATALSDPPPHTGHYLAADVRAHRTRRLASGDGGSGLADLLSGDPGSHPGGWDPLSRSGWQAGRTPAGW
jgi:hypothetical protein